MDEMKWSFRDIRELDGNALNYILSCIKRKYREERKAMRRLRSRRK